ncbi:MAG: TPM domain-containing protein [Gemmatimonadales bacterium]
MIRVALLMGLVAGAVLAPHPAIGQTSTDVPPGLRKIIPPVPTPESFVSDANHVLTPDAHAALDIRIRELQAAGYGDIAVAIIADIGDYSPNQVSVAIYRNWRVGSVAAIGSAHRDIGVLLLIVPKELAPNKKGQCYIAPGTGAEGILTDATSASICRDAIIPSLKTRDYPTALTAGVNAIALRLQSDAGLAESTSTAMPVAEPKSENSNGPSPLWFIPGGIGATLASLFGVRRWRRNRPRKCPRCGRQMTRMSETADNSQLVPGQQLEEQLKSVDYDVWECVCGEHLVLPYKAIFSRYSACRECHRRTAKSTRQVIEHATTSSSGLAHDTYICASCHASWVVTVTLPRISESSSSGGSSGGGGGGSSFGGSGSSSGGGGGGSY